MPTGFANHMFHQIEGLGAPTTTYTAILAHPTSGATVEFHIRQLDGHSRRGYIQNSKTRNKRYDTRRALVKR